MSATIANNIPMQQMPYYPQAPNNMQMQYYPQAPNNMQMQYYPPMPYQQMPNNMEQPPKYTPMNNMEQPPMYTPTSNMEQRSMNSLMNSEGESRDQIKEVKEAIQASEDALMHLEKAKKNLKKANNWGIVDILGGDLITTLVKQDKISNARRHMKAAQDALKKLEDEIKDVKDFHIPNDEFLTLADFFFDGLFADIMVQSKISKAREKCNRAITDVVEIKKNLVLRLNKLEREK